MARLYRISGDGTTFARCFVLMGDSRPHLTLRGWMNDPMPDESTVSRREFVTGLTALGAVWLTAAACAKEAPKAVDSSASAIMPMANDSTSVAQTLTHFTAEQAAEVEAIASRIIPTDDTPGAKEAGVVYFIDHAIQPGGVAADQGPLFAAGLESLSNAVAKSMAQRQNFRRSPQRSRTHCSRQSRRRRFLVRCVLPPSPDSSRCPSTAATRITSAGR